MDDLTRTNADAARRLFEAVENRNPQGVAAIYHENIVIHEAPSLPYGGEFFGHEGALRHGQGFRAIWEVRSGTGKASGQPGIVSSLRKRVVLSHASSRRATTLRCCGDTGQRITKPESASICPPPASTASWMKGSSTPECSTSTSRRCSSF